MRLQAYLIDGLTYIVDTVTGNVTRVLKESGNVSDDILKKIIQKMNTHRDRMNEEVSK